MNSVEGIANDLLPALEAEALERKAAGGRGEDTQLIAEADKGESLEKAAKITNTNRQYISDAKKIAAEDLEALEQIRSGAKTITEVKKERAIAERHQEAEDRGIHIAGAIHSLPPKDYNAIWGPSVGSPECC